MPALVFVAVALPACMPSEDQWLYHGRHDGAVDGRKLRDDGRATWRLPNIHTGELCKVTPSALGLKRAGIEQHKARELTSIWILNCKVPRNARSSYQTFGWGAGIGAWPNPKHHAFLREIAANETLCHFEMHQQQKQSKSGTADHSHTFSWLQAEFLTTSCEFLGSLSYFHHDKFLYTTGNKLWVQVRLRESLHSSPVW